MIDEWGNEIKENSFLTFKAKIYESRYLLISLFGAAIFTLAIIQVVGFFYNKKSPDSITSGKPTPAAVQITPRAQKNLSPLATESGFIRLEEMAATLSAAIDAVDLYESGLMFPPVNTKVTFGEK